jgi:hypothetical protein
VNEAFISSYFAKEYGNPAYGNFTFSKGLGSPLFPDCQNVFLTGGE